MTNQERNMALQEAFGQLEQLCNQMYKDKHGVTAYIDEMKAKQPQGRFAVPHWDAVLKRLQQVRHVRNQISHGASFRDALATEMDVAFVRAFHASILKRQDPLALLRAHQQRTAAKPRPVAATPPKPQPQPLPKAVSKPKKESSGYGLNIALTLIAVGLIVAICLVAAQIFS